MTKHNPWTDEETTRAARLYAIGYSPLRIGALLGRQQHSVYRKLRALGVTKPCPRSGHRRGVTPPLRRRNVDNFHEAERNPWHPARDPIPARYDWFHGARQEQTAV